MPFSTLPTKTPGQTVRASYLNQIKANEDDHEDRLLDLEAGGGTGNVVGPASAVDNEIPRYDGTTGELLQGSGITIADGASGTLAGSNSGDVTLAGSPNYLTIAGQVITRALIDLAAHITGRLPFANLTAATAANRLLGRGSAGGAGDFQEIALGAGLSMSGNTLSATGGGGAGALDDLTDTIITTPAADDVLQYNGSEWINQPAENLSASNLSSGTVPAGRMPALTGDVTSSAGAVATTIANDAVSNAKAANMAQATIKGRAAAAGTGDPTDLTPDQVSTILDAATDPFLRTSAGGGGGGDLDDLTDVVIASPTTDEVLKYNGSNWVNGSVPGGGGGGDISSGPYASLPAAGNTGDCYIPTDSHYSILRDNGSSWDHFFTGRLFVPPVDGSYAWVNQNTASKDTTRGGVILTKTATAAHDINLRVKSAPSTPYVITAAIAALRFAGAFYGLAFRQSSDGKLVTFGIGLSNQSFHISSWSSPTAFNSHYLQLPIFSDLWPYHQAVTWLRMADDGTDRKFYVSADGVNWYEIIGARHSRTNYMTADQVGIFIHTQATTNYVSLWNLSWVET